MSATWPIRQLGCKECVPTWILGNKFIWNNPQASLIPLNLILFANAKNPLWTGLNQAPQTWFGWLANYLLHIGFTDYHSDPSLFLFLQNSDLTFCFSFFPFMLLPTACILIPWLSTCKINQNYDHIQFGEQQCLSLILLCVLFFFSKVENHLHIWKLF